MTVVLGKELQNTSKTLPNHSTSMRGAGFCKGYAGTPLLESRFRGGTHLFLLCHDFRGRVYIVIRSYVYKINIDFGMSPISHWRSRLSPVCLLTPIYPLIQGKLHWKPHPRSVSGFIQLTRCADLILEDFCMLIRVETFLRSGAKSSNSYRSGMKRWGLRELV